MDELTFLHELREIKAQVFAMRSRNKQDSFATISQSLPPPPRPPTSHIHDTLSAQMNTIKTRLAALGAQVSACQPQIDPFTTSLHDATTTQSDHLTLYPEPPSKTLLTSLNSHVQGLDGRVAHLEYSLSDLEDHIGYGREHLFTPVSSEGRPDIDAHVIGLNRSSPVGPPPLENMSKRLSQLKDERSPPQLPTSKAESESVQSQSILHTLLSHDNNQSIRAGHLESSLVEHEHTKEIRELQQAVLDLQQRTNRVTVDKAPGQGCSRCDQHTMTGNTAAHPACADLNLRDLLRQDIHNLEQRHHKDINSLYQIVVQSNSAHKSAKDLGCVESSTIDDLAATPYRLARSQAWLEEVAFRDKEIARLDELLRGVQDQLRSSEQHAVKKEKPMTVLQPNHKQCHDRMDNMIANIMEKHRALISAQRVVAARDAEIDRLLLELSDRQKVVDAWRRGHKRLEQDIRDCQSDRDAARQHSQRLIGLLREAEAHKHIYTTSRADEINQLHGFCKQKDTIADEQEAIIARGAVLLQQRDEEIEEMTGQLRAVQQDRQSEDRRASELADLLERKTKESTKMRSKIIHMCDWPKIHPWYDGKEEVELKNRLNTIRRLVTESQDPSPNDMLSDRKKSQASATEASDEFLEWLASTKEASSLSCARPQPCGIKPHDPWSSRSFVGLKTPADEVTQTSAGFSNYGLPNSRLREMSCADGTVSYTGSGGGPTQPDTSPGAVTAQMYDKARDDETPRSATDDRKLEPREGIPSVSADTNITEPQRLLACLQEPKSMPALLISPDSRPFHSQASSTAVRHKMSDTNLHCVSDAPMNFLAATVESDTESAQGGDVACGLNHAYAGSDSLPETGSH